MSTCREAHGEGSDAVRPFPRGCVGPGNLGKKARVTWGPIGVDHQEAINKTERGKREIWPKGPVPSLKAGAVREARASTPLTGKAGRGKRSEGRVRTNREGKSDSKSASGQKSPWRRPIRQHVSPGRKIVSSKSIAWKG